MIPYRAVPQVYDPPSHLIVTANQRPVTAAYPYYTGTSGNFYDPGYRAAYAHAYLRAHEPLSGASIAALQNSVTDPCRGPLRSRIRPPVLQRRAAARQGSRQLACIRAGSRRIRHPRGTRTWCRCGGTASTFRCRPPERRRDRSAGGSMAERGVIGMLRRAFSRSKRLTWRGSLGWAVTFIVAAAIMAGTAQAGAWFVPFLAGVAAGLASPRVRGAVPLAVAASVAGWALPLWVLALRGLPVGATARAIAGLAGLPPYAVVIVVVTLLLAALQVLAGAWLARALLPLLRANE